MALVLALSDKIEAARLPKGENYVFSYRYEPDDHSGDLFDRSFGWVPFMQHSMKLSEKFEFVVACDISEFYPRLGHHRLENALLQVAGDTQYPKRIMDFLSNFSLIRSFGLPIGGPASRILSEITINQVDRLLAVGGTPFVRFADDYHLFAHSREDAYRHLFLLSEKLFENQGLSLQKSKTRIMTSAEFRATSPLRHHTADPVGEDDVIGPPTQDGLGLMHFSLRFDPYSPTAERDYARLKDEIRRFDIIGLLKQELAKSRIHIALARKIVSAIRFLDEGVKDDAVLSILDNCDVLYPIFASVLLMIEQVIGEISPAAKQAVIAKIQELIRNQSHVLRVDVHLTYAIRILAHENSPDNQALLQKLYEDRSSPLIRRDIILVLAKWGEWYWLSDRKNRFRELSGPERRAFIVGSYVLKDEGRHWRDHIRKELSPFELFIMKWAGEKRSNPKRTIPL